MEKLVRWHQWMDPVRLARQTGPFIFSCVLILSIPHSHATLSRGHPSKDFRRLVTEKRSDPQPTEEEVSKEPVAVAEVQGPKVVEGPVSEEPVTEPIRTVIRGKQGYLPELGDVPLRFAAPKVWPAPLPEEVRLALHPKEADQETVDQVSHLDDRLGEDPVPLLEEIIAQALPEEDARKLTAELVIGYLGSIKQGRAEASVQFQPAIYDNGPVSTPVPAALATNAQP